MKLLFILFALSLVVLALGDPTTFSPRGYIWNEGRRGRECEAGTHSYTTGCGHKTPEATCDEPNPVPERGTICDYTACYCDAPTVRDTTTKKCVKIEDCPKNP